MGYPSRLLPLLAGLTLGIGATFTLRQLHPTSSDLLAPGASLLAPSSTPSPALIIPPRLADDEAVAALDAWLALGAPTAGTDAQPADFATQSTALRALLTVLPDALFSRLLETLISREGDDARRLRQIAFNRWTERSSPDAARWAAAAPASKTFDAKARAKFAQQAAKSWALLDFDSAYAWAAALPDSDLSRSLARALLVQLAATEPTRALTLAQAAGPEFLTTNQRELFHAWAAHDPAAAVRTLGPTLLAADWNDWYLQTSLAAWVKKDAPAALVWINALPADGSGYDSLLRRILPYVASVTSGDLRPLADALTALPDSPHRFSDLSSLLNGWREKDPAAAIAWLDTLPDPAQRADLLTKNIHDDRPDLTHPDQFLPFALHLPPSPERDTKIANLLTGWARTDPDAALAWLQTHNDPSLAVATTRVQGVLIGALAATDPAAALARWQELPPGEARAAAEPAIAAAWAKTDPAAATRWINDQLPPLPAAATDRTPYAALSPETQAEVLKGYENHLAALSPAASAWFKKDPLAALAWAEALPDPAQRQNTLAVLQSTSADADTPDPALRAAILAHITDPALRTKTLSGHLRNWMRSDLPSARAWIESSDALSPELAAALLATP